MIRGLILAFQFLTRIPLPLSIEFNPSNVRYAISFFGVVGCVLGGIYYFCFSLFHGADPLIGAAICLLMTLILTGGLHIDGLSDMADGFFSGRDREKTLEIMKDSRAGAFGVMAIVCILLMKFVFIYRMQEGITLFFMAANARFSSYLLILFGKPAYEGGLAKLFQETRSASGIAGAFLLYLTGVYVVGVKHFIPLLFSILISGLLLLWSQRKIGGVNGDVNGACIELSELVTLMTYWGMMLWK